MKSSYLLHTVIRCIALLAVFATACINIEAQTNKPKTPQKNLDFVSEQATTTQTDEDDEKLDDSFRKFGSAAGAAYQCTAPADREKVVSDVRQAYTRIGQLFGTDRAFIFAVHFGNASQNAFDKAKCPELLKKLRESVLIRRGQQQGGE